MNFLKHEIHRPAQKPGKPGVIVSSNRAEAGLARCELGFCVVSKTPAMGAPAFTYYTDLRDAWAAYTRHRALVRALKETTA